MKSFGTTAVAIARAASLFAAGELSAREARVDSSVHYDQAFRGVR